MAEIPGGGRTREPGEMWIMPLKNATSLDDAGYVLTYVTESSVVKVDKCGATDIPRCVNYTSTRDPHDLNFPWTQTRTGTQLEGVGVWVLAEGWSKLKVATNNAAIAIGDPLKVASSGGGKVDKYAKTTIPDTSATNASNELEARFKELAQIVGRAEEAVAAGTTSAAGADKVLTKLTIGSVLYI